MVETKVLFKGTLILGVNIQMVLCLHNKTSKEYKEKLFPCLEVVHLCVAS
jgi:hypothetical protein